MVAVADLFASMAYIEVFFGLTETETGCKIQGAQSHFFELASVLGTGTMSVYLYQIFLFTSLYSTSEPPHATRRIVTSWVFTYGVPLATALYVGVNDGFGPASVWCWIYCDDVVAPKGCTWRMTLFYYELYACLLFNIVTYIVIFFVLRSKGGKGNKDVYSRKVAKKLRMYLLAFAGAWVAPCVNRLFQSFYDSDFSLPWLDYVMAFTNPLMGFLDAVVYSSNSGAWKMWRDGVLDIWPDGYVVKDNSRLRQRTRPQAMSPTRQPDLSCPDMNDVGNGVI
ncbi:GCR1-cAMP receptor [Kipferlia bialata]|uniref:GCR1-cAMP receptor n=1 Tax=Kipferlia bialata TaxID=797122 RepID=A0A9K3CWQ1_9EUKA|nr:GCR1-cAMP receptor [Kipferlia bialata]|eukprot:g6228.t1